MIKNNCQLPENEELKIKYGMACVLSLIVGGLFIITSLIIYISSSLENTYPYSDKQHLLYGTPFYVNILVYFLTQIEVIIATNVTVFQPDDRIVLKKRRPSLALSSAGLLFV